MYNSGSAQFYPVPSRPDFVNTIATVDNLNIGSSTSISQVNSLTIGTGNNRTFVLDGGFTNGPDLNGGKIIIGGRVSA